MRKKSPRKRTTGVRLVLWLLAAALAVGAAEKPKKPGAEPYALIFGTIFRENGLAFGGAKVTLETAEEKDRKNKKFKSQTLASDRRGEFALRVAVEPMRYTVVVQAPGYEDQRKPVEIRGDERIDLSFLMELKK